MRKILALVAAVAMVAGLSSTALATKPDPNHKVTICHRTNSTTNPYVKITVDEASVNQDTGDDKGQGDHNAQHNGPVWNSSMPNGGDWGDIIPPFYANGDSGYWPSKNWTADGIAIFNNGCKPTTPPPVQHSPSLDADVVCNIEDEKYIVTYTGKTDGADNTVPDLPVVHTLPGTATSDSQSVTFKYSDGPDVTLTVTVKMAGDCADGQVVHEPTLKATATCDLVAEVYTVTYTGNTDGAESTVPTLPIIRIIPATDKDQKDSATVVFKYSDGPDVTLTASITLPAGCITEVEGEKETNKHNDTKVRGGFAYTL